MRSAVSAQSAGADLSFCAPGKSGRITAPDDIWQHIASFIAREDMNPLLEVNQALYNFVMDAKYREVIWAKVDGPLIRSLVRLSNPSVARRVRRLDVRAWFIEYLNNRPEAFVLVLKSRINVFRSSKPNKPLRLNTASSASEIFGAMIAAVELMTSVTEYIFEWRDLSPSNDTLRFLGSARAAFGLSLRKLTLRAQLDNFPHLVSTVDFDSLEDLVLHFDHDAWDSTKEKDLILLRDGIAPFINHFRHSIGNLSISSSSKMDLSSLFHFLATFPKLGNLFLCLSFDTWHLSDPSGLVKILKLHNRALQKLTFAHSYASSTSKDVGKRGWIHLSSLILSEPDSLCGLKYLRMPSLASFSDTLLIFGRSKNSLTELVLVDYFLTESEVVELVAMFSHRPFDLGLKRLHIGITSPTPTLFDILANRVPGLSILNLVLPSGVAGEATLVFLDCLASSYV
ncbi:hypothetical protein B0H10DRAFT_1865697 [Mycena sp. CBHHK59/15]|nr:hypothetical protein B0H10DRAFT_1865697 [Mycena sp. CBHHK59/15]